MLSWLSYLKAWINVLLSKSFTGDCLTINNRLQRQNDFHFSFFFVYFLALIEKLEASHQELQCPIEGFSVPPKASVSLQKLQGLTKSFNIPPKVSVFQQKLSVSHQKLQCRTKGFNFTSGKHLTKKMTKRWWYAFFHLYCSTVEKFECDIKKKKFQHRH